LGGFRADYLGRVLGASAADAPFPALRWLAAQGAVAASLRGVFPTSSAPNHWAIASGLYPDWRVPAAGLRCPRG
jgi:predicted AlkP superfamily pyrophosphatase or phosphodiesterase